MKELNETEMRSIEGGDSIIYELGVLLGKLLGSLLS